MKTWSDKETITLLEKYNTVSNDDLCSAIPNKTWMAIYKKAYKLGLRKSVESEFLNRSLSRRREKASNWNGGASVTSKGYRIILVSDHNRADKKGYVLEHIYVWEKETKMIIPSGFCLHHLNGDKKDNRIENLALMTIGAHTKHHHTGSKRSVETRKRISEKARNRK